MSCDIHLFDRETKQTAMRMNWLRNPFGLVQWAEDNAHHVWGKVPNKTLWYVVNHWNYKKSPRVNRPLFKRVVDQYAATLAEMDTTYFFFDVYDFRQFIQENMRLLPTEVGLSRMNIVGERMSNDRRLMLPLELFKEGFYLSPSTHIGYQQWFRELVKFASLLQDKRYSFYCDN